MKQTHLYSKYGPYDKLTKVIDSCITLDQVRAGAKLIILFHEMYYPQHLEFENDYARLTVILNDRLFNQAITLHKMNDSVYNLIAVSLPNIED